MRLTLLGALAATGCAVTPAPLPLHLAAAAIAPPPGTHFETGVHVVTIGPGGVFTPSRVWVRPGASTRFVNRDAKPHTVFGFGGATSRSGVLAPGGTYTHHWRHPGTWTFHDSLTPNAPAFTLVDIPG